MAKNKQNKEIITGPPIIIPQQINRDEIVKKVIIAFIDFEKNKNRRGIEFRYPVENLSICKQLYIHRPGMKLNFDFKVEIPKNCGIKKGTHEEIASILRKIKGKNENEFNNMWKIISHLYHCENNNVDCLLEQYPVSLDSPPPDVLLKVIKWLFIMEDIIYWNHEGRAFLYNFLKYATNETDEQKLKQTLKGIKKGQIKPPQLIKLFEEWKIKWISP